MTVFIPEKDLTLLEIKNERLNSEVKDLKAQYFSLKAKIESTRFEASHYRRLLKPDLRYVI